MPDGQAGGQEKERGGELRGPSVRRRREDVRLLVQRLEDEHREHASAPPLFVNPAQFHRIVRRREARERMLGVQTGATPRIAAQTEAQAPQQKYRFETRHRAAAKRQRDAAGRFLRGEDTSAALAPPQEKRPAPSSPEPQPQQPPQQASCVDGPK